MTTSLLAFILAISSLHAGEQKSTARVPRTRPVFEFQRDDTSLVLRTLARQMSMNLVVHEGLQGTTTLRLEDKTSREVFDIIVEANGWKSFTRKGVTYVTLKNQEQLDADKAIARQKKAQYDALVAEGFTKDEALKLLLAGIQAMR